jgi:outer membrane lipopolysaccharide assembly protein LptE/RlpB
VRVRAAALASGRRVAGIFLQGVGGRRVTTPARHGAVTWAPILVVLAAPTLAGCGYHLVGEKVGLPENVRSLSVGTIDNRSREYGLEKALAFALEREIHERGHLRMVEDPKGGDAVLTGTIHDLKVRPVAFDSNDQALQYEMTLILDFTLTRQNDGRVLWRVRRLEETAEYSSGSQAVVTSSSEFQQGTLNADNLPCVSGSSRPCNVQFSTIQLAETLRRRAITRLLREAVRDFYNQMVEDF